MTPRESFMALDLATREAVHAWIAATLVPAQTQGGRTSYGCKHQLEGDTGIYVTSDQFAGALMLQGFRIAEIIRTGGTENYRFCMRPRAHRSGMRVVDRGEPREALRHAPPDVRDRVLLLARAALGVV